MQSTFIYESQLASLESRLQTNQSSTAGCLQSLKRLNEEPSRDQHEAKWYIPIHKYNRYIFGDPDWNIKRQYLFQVIYCNEDNDFNTLFDLFVFVVYFYIFNRRFTCYLFKSHGDKLCQ